MKNYTKFSIASLIFATFSFTSCLELSSGPQDAESSLRQTVSQASSIELGQLPCDFDSRKTTGYVKEEVGYIMPGPGHSDANPFYLIDVPARSMRYTACNMPEAVKRAGMMIRFSGEEKEIFANERWAGSPFKLTSIDIMEADPVIFPTSNASFN